jgi:hypothetical protein
VISRPWAARLDVQQQGGALAGQPIIRCIEPKFDDPVPRHAVLEKILDGHGWLEGPLWVPGGEYRLFSDVPRNTITMEGRPGRECVAGLPVEPDRRECPHLQGTALDPARPASPRDHRPIGEGRYTVGRKAAAAAGLTLGRLTTIPTPTRP